MTSKNEIGVSFVVDKRGNELVQIAVASREGVQVTMYKRDYEMLTKVGVSMRLFLVSDGKGRLYVRTHKSGVTGGQLTIARLISDAGPNEAVRYADRDPLNLRRENLLVGKGRAVRDDRELFLTAELNGAVDL